MNWMYSDINVLDPAALKAAVDHADNSFAYDGRGNGDLYAHGDVVDMRDISTLATFAPFIQSGYVQLSDDAGNVCRYVFGDGAVKKMIPQWIDA